MQHVSKKREREIERVKEREHKLGIREKTGKYSLDLNYRGL